VTGYDFGKTGDSQMGANRKPRLAAPAASVSQWIGRLAATVGSPAFEQALRQAVHGLSGADDCAVSTDAAPAGPELQYAPGQVSLHLRENGRTITLSAFRRGEGGGFNEAELKRLSRSADLLMAFVVRHNELNPPAPRPAHGLSVEQATGLVRALGANLPRRELEVCARILRGLTMEAVALDLGIGVSSAITYKRRAYARLGISGTAELFARCLGAER
jgi:DNA-binding CsgD family transcriptional regulator